MSAQSHLHRYRSEATLIRAHIALNAAFSTAEGIADTLAEAV